MTIGSDKLELYVDGLYIRHAIMYKYFWRTMNIGTFINYCVVGPIKYSFQNYYYFFISFIGSNF